MNSPRAINRRDFSRQLAGGIGAALMSPMLGFAAFKEAVKLQTYQPAVRAHKSQIYRVTVNGQPVFPERFHDIDYVHFSAGGEVTVSVRTPSRIRKFSISPKARGIAAEAVGDTLTFTLTEPCQLIVTIGDAQRLFVFADAIDTEAPVPGRPGVASILDFDVDASGVRLETGRIQRAIDEVSRKGGTLYFPPGTYLTGTLALKSNLTLYLAGGTVLLGSPNREDYPVDAGFKEADLVNDPEHYTNQGAKMTYSRLLLVDHASNVRIAGRGVIDGQGQVVRPQGKPANLLRIRDSSNVTVEGVFLRNPAAWNTHVLHSDRVTFRDVKVLNNRTVRNTDGINPDASRDVLVERCFFYCGDDAVAIKTSGNSRLLRNAERITVRDCVMLTRKSAMKLGTESFAEYERDITFENNDVVEADRAMSLYCSDGAKFENIRWLNNRVESTYPDSQRRTLHFTVIERGGDEPGHIRNVLIKDTLVAEASPNPLVMKGHSEAHGIRDVRFVNFSVGGRMCHNAAEARLETNEFVSDVSFSVE
ncbi:MAG: glycoside hydrolase family 28 protein [Opitutaceae bacterium]